jgi:hypothetical protein
MRIQIAPQPYTEHGLARFFTWARLWLQWALAAFAQHAELILQDGSMRAHLERMRRTIACMIFLRACERRPRRRRAPGRNARARTRNSALRILIGAHFRRALRGKTDRGRGLAARIETLARILRDPEPAIAALAARLARRFTRLAPLPAPPRRLCMETTAPGLIPAPADTS